jgi:hypothetical protein
MNSFSGKMPGIGTESCTIERTQISQFNDRNLLFQGHIHLFVAYATFD